MRKVLFIFSFFIVACSVDSKNVEWIKWAVAVDGSSITYHSKVVEAGENPPFVGRKTLTSYKAAQTTKSGNRFQSYVSDELFKCGAKLFSPVKIDYYSGSMATGTVTESHERTLKEAANDLYKIEPSSNAEATYNASCSRVGF